jgi:hypothetical protein
MDCSKSARTTLKVVKWWDGCKNLKRRNSKYVCTNLDQNFI